MSLKLKILIFFLVTSLVPLVLMGWIGVLALQDNLYNRLESEELLRARETAHDLKQLMQTHISESRLIATLPDLTQMILKAQQEVPQISAMSQAEAEQADREWIERRGQTPLGRQIAQNSLSRYLRMLQQEPHPAFGELFITDVQGRVLGASGQLTDFLQADEGWWQAAWDGGKGQMMLDDRGYDRSIDALTLGVVLPVERHGKIIAILKINFKVGDIFAEIDAPRDISVYPYLARSNGSMLIGDRPGEAAFELPLEQALAQEKALGHLRFVDRGREYLVFYSQVDQVLYHRQVANEASRGIGGEKWQPVRWVFMRVIDAQLLEAPIRVTVWRFGWIGLLVLAAAASWGFLARSLIDRPIEVLNQGVSALAAGDYSVRIAPLKEPELAPVARTLNRMAERIQKEQERLEETVRRRTHEVHEQERLFRNLFDASFDGIVISHQGRIIETNEATAKLFGYSNPRELIGMGQTDLWEPESAARIIEAMRTHVDQTLTFQGRLKSGRQVALESVGRRLQYKGLEVRAAAFREITDRIEREQEILALNRQLTHLVDELHRSNKDLEQFAYVASHDLQEPLRAISGFLQILVMDYSKDLNADAKELIDRVLAAASRMKSQIEDLLAYSRLHTRAKASVALDLNEVLDEVTHLLQVAIEEKGAQVRYGELPVVLGERTQMVQLFQNLITNALKFHGEDPPVVEIGFEDRGQEVELSVADNGIGFEPEFAERIFEIFQRLHSRNRYEGTGIGLALVRRIVQLHGGEIRAQSEPGQGAKFLFNLPKPQNQAES